MSALTQEADGAAALRAAFDDSFAAAPAPATESGEKLLLVGVAGRRLLLRLADIVGLFGRPRIVAVPRTSPALLGITGLRGAIVSVFDLGLALGWSSAAGTAPGWLVIAAGRPLAFAFDDLQRHVAIPLTSITASERTDGYLRETAMLGEEALAVVDLRALAAAA